MSKIIFWSVRRCSCTIEKISGGVAPLRRETRLFFWSVRRCNRTIKKESGGSHTMHWDFTPLQRYPHDCKLKRSTPQSHHALRFHVSPKVSTRLQVEEENTTAAPLIWRKIQHTSPHKGDSLTRLPPWKENSPHIYRTSVGSTFSTNSMPQPVDICSHLTARHPGCFVAPQPAR